MSFCKAEKLQPPSTLAAEGDSRALPAAACTPRAPHCHQSGPAPNRAPPRCRRGEGDAGTPVAPAPQPRGLLQPMAAPPHRSPAPCSPFPPSSASLARKEWL